MSEDAGAPSKLDTMTIDDLKKLVKKYMVLQKQLKSKNEGIFILINYLLVKSNRI